MKTKGRIAAEKYREISMSEFFSERNRKAYVEAKKKQDSSPQAIRDKKAREAIQPLHPLERYLQAAIKKEDPVLIEKANNALVQALIIAAETTCALMQDDLNGIIEKNGSANFKDVINIVTYYKHNIARIKNLCKETSTQDFTAYKIINDKYLKLKNKYEKAASV